MVTLLQGELILQYCEMKQACLANRSSERCGRASVCPGYKGWMLDVRCRIAVQCFVVVTCFFARTSLLNSAHGGGSARWRCRRPVALIASVSRNFEILAAKIIIIYIYFFPDLWGILFWERCPGSYEVTEIGVKNAWKFRNLRGLNWSQKGSPNWCRIHFLLELIRWHWAPRSDKLSVYSGNHYYK